MNYSFKMIFLVVTIFLYGNSIFATIKNSNASLPKKLSYCTVSWLSDERSENGLGPDVEIANSFAKFLNVKMEKIKVNWTELFEKSPKLVDTSGTYTPFLLKNKCSFYAVSMTVTDWRKQLINIVPIYAGRTMIVTRNEDKDLIYNISSLQNKKTAVIKNTTYSSWLKKINDSTPKLNIQIKEYETISTVDLLIQKSVDFILLDTIQALYFINKNKNKLNMAFPASPNERIGWGFNYNDNYLSDAFQNYLQLQKANPKSDLNKIFIKYFGVSSKEFDTLVFSSVQN